MPELPDDEPVSDPTAATQEPQSIEAATARDKDDHAWRLVVWDTELLDDIEFLGGSGEG